MIKLYDILNLFFIILHKKIKQVILNSKKTFNFSNIIFFLQLIKKRKYSLYQNNYFIFNHNFKNSYFNSYLPYYLKLDFF